MYLVSVGHKGLGQFDIMEHLREESVVENEDFDQFVTIFLNNWNCAYFGKGGAYNISYIKEQKIVIHEKYHSISELSHQNFQNFQKMVHLPNIQPKTCNSQKHHSWPIQHLLLFENILADLHNGRR